MSNLNANAKSWKPNANAKEWTPAAPAAPQAPVANTYHNNGGYQQHGYYPAPQFALPYLDINGFPVYPMVPSIMQMPNGEYMQVGVVPNPQYAPDVNSVFVSFDYIPPVVAVNYSEIPPVPSQAPVAGAPAQIADAPAAAPAPASATPAAAAPVDAAPAVAPPAATAEPVKAAAAAEAPKAPVAAESVAAPAASAAPAAAAEKLSIETPNSIKETTDADHKAANGKLTYDKTTMIAFYEKSAIGAADAAIAKMYGNFANKSREPIGFYFSTMKGSSSHANLSSHNSSSSLNNMRGKNAGGDDRVLERGQKLENRKEKHLSKSRLAEQERRERAEREDELYYGDASTPLPSPAMAGYKSVFKVEEGEVEATVRKANLILNKLSVTKFDKLSDEFMAVGLLETPQLMVRAVDLIVMKAQMEEHFCFMYADLCSKIVKQGTAIMPEKTEDGVAASGTASPAPDAAAGGDDEGGEGKTSGPRTMGEIFRAQLLERCQMEFESDRVQALDAIRNNAELTAEEKVEKEILLKKRYTGTMRFIGELYIKDLIRANVMSGCLDILLGCTEEDELVCMAKLFQTIGMQLEGFYADKAKASKTKAKRAKYEAVMPEYLAKIAKLAEDHPSSRVRYMMRDLVDLQSNKWVPRRETEKVVSLEIKTLSAAAGAAAAAEQPNSPKPSEAWTTVSTAKSKSSANLSSMTSALNQYANSGANKGKFPESGGGSKGGSSTPKGGPGLPRSTSSGAVNRPSQAAPSPRGPGGGDKKGFGAASAGGKGGKPLPSESTVTVKPGSTPASATAASPAAPAAPVVDESAPFDKESSTYKRIKSTVEEYYMNNLMEEVFIVLGELPIPQSHLQEILKYLIIGSLEKTDANRSSLAKLIIAMHEKGVLSTQHVTDGLLQFLHEYDDIVIDVPLAGAYATGFIGELVAAGCANLTLFKDIPDENNFSFHSRVAEFIVQVLASAAKFRPESEVKEMLVQSGIDLKANVRAGPRESLDEVFAEILKKHNATFLL